MSKYIYFNRDISWLSFNERVLDEAAREAVPLAERFKFLAIFSSNLDEWFRVRMPVLIAKQQFAIHRPNSKYNLSASLSGFDEAKEIINRQQEKFGDILRRQLLPLLQENNVLLLYHQPMPAELTAIISDYFFTTVAAFLQPQLITSSTVFFPENNKLYLLVSYKEDGGEVQAVVNIPSDVLPRFYSILHNNKQYIIFIDDVIKQHLHVLFNNKEINHCCSFKINRDAELNLEDELPDTLAEKIEKQVAARDSGNASRLLYAANIPLRLLQLLCNLCNTTIANAMEGGTYHNLKDLLSLPLYNDKLYYAKQQPIPVSHYVKQSSLFEAITENDIVIHPPYNSYGTVLRFFNTAAIDATVTEIYVTLYRIASDSKIANALISAAKNGKKVQVFVELKARFDEANNIRWAKQMKAAGVKVIYSIPRLKVHAKIALIKRRINDKEQCFGLLATGNLNEATARLYTDHILLTAHTEMLQEMEWLFSFLSNRKKPESNDDISFKHLLVAQFNLQKQFIYLINKEIENAAKGLPAAITIKLNNLEEQTLIDKLYEASNAGVKVQLIVRSICCLVPGVSGMSENIIIKRIVGRYLEHGRVFIFHNNGNEKVFMGSADWMNRNIYTRIEVCFPVYDEQIKKQMTDIIQLQWSDNMQAVYINSDLQNIPVTKEAEEPSVDSQAEMYALLKTDNVV